MVMVVMMVLCHDTEAVLSWWLQERLVACFSTVTAWSWPDAAAVATRSVASNRTGHVAGREWLSGLEHARRPLTLSVGHSDVVARG